MEREQPYDPFEFAEEEVDKKYRKDFVMDTGMEAGNAATPAQPRIGDVPVPIEVVKEKPKPKLTTRQKVRQAIKEMS